MSGTVRCACCDLPIPVTADDVGLTVTCPRTRKLIRVREADVRAEKSPVPTTKSAAPHAGGASPPRATLPEPLPPESLPPGKAVRTNRLLVVIASVQALLLIAAIGYGVGGGFQTDRAGDTTRPAEAARPPEPALPAAPPPRLPKARVEEPLAPKPEIVPPRDPARAPLPALPEPRPVPPPAVMPPDPPPVVAAEPIHPPRDIGAELEGHLKAAKDPDPAVRRGAAEALAAFLRKESDAIRRKAAAALAELGRDSEPAAAALKEALADADAEVRKAARQALADLDEAAAAAKAAKTREAILATAKDLKAKEPEKRIRVLDQIAAFGPDANIIGEQLIEAMADPVPSVQAAASEALEKVNPKVHPHVFTLMFGMNKQGAVIGLGKLGSEAAIAVPLLLYLRENPPVQIAGKARQPVPVILGDLLSTVAQIAPKDKRLAAAVLASIAAPIPPNDSSAITSGPGLTRRRAGLAQVKVIEADPADKVKALTAAMNDGVGLLHVIEALGGLGKDAEAALPVLKKLKVSPNDAIRNAATRAITAIE